MDNILEVGLAIGVALLALIKLVYTGVEAVVLMFYGTTFGHEVLVSGSATLLLAGIVSTFVFWSHIRGLWFNEDWENMEFSINYLAADGFFRIEEQAVVKIKDIFLNPIVRRQFYKAMKRADRKKTSDNKAGAASEDAELLNYGSNKTAKMIRKAMKSFITKHYGEGYVAEMAKRKVDVIPCLFAATFQRHTGPDAPIAMARLICVVRDFALSSPRADDPTIQVSKDEYRHRLTTIAAIGARYTSLRKTDAETLAKKGKDPQDAAYMQVRLVHAA